MQFQTEIAHKINEVSRKITSVRVVDNEQRLGSFGNVETAKNVSF